MIRLCAILILSAAYCCPAVALPFKPVTSGSFDDVPIQHAMATLHVLGEWTLSDGWLKIFSMHGGFAPHCNERDDAPENCRNARIYVSTNFDHMNYALYRGPNGMDWRLPEKEELKILGSNDYSIRLCGYQSLPNTYHAGLADYTLHIHRRLIGSGHFDFSIAVDKKNLRTGESNADPGHCSSFVPLISLPILPRQKRQTQ